MRFVWSSILLSTLGWAASVRAQVNLPPPPPPPLNTENPPPANPPPSTTPRRPPSRPPPRETPRDTREVRERPPPPSYEPAYTPRSGRVWSIRLNPLALAVSRLSADVEWMFLSKHSLVLSPHVTFPQNRAALPARAVGFAGNQASGFGVELGYRYYFGNSGEPEGLFLGPSLLLDSTRSRPGADRFVAYGGAVDVGYQVIVGSGFTLGAGGGLLVIGAKNTSAEVAPRVLLSVGWTF